MWYRLQRHDGTDCSATMVPFTPLRMVPIQRYRHNLEVSKRLITITPSHEQKYKYSVRNPQFFHRKTNQSRLFQVYDPS